MTEQSDLPILTKQDRRRLKEIYLSGFLSGAASAMITAGMSEERASAVSDAMTDSVSQDEDAMKDMWATIVACMEDRDLPPGPIREVGNVRLP